MVPALLSLLSGALIPPLLAVAPARAAELLEIQLEDLEIPIRLDQLDGWSRHGGQPAPGGEALPGPTAPGAGGQASPPAADSSPATGRIFRSGSSGSLSNRPGGAPPVGTVSPTTSEPRLTRLDRNVSATATTSTSTASAASAIPAASDGGNDLEVWLNLLEPDSRRSLIRLLQAPLLRDRTFGSQLLDTWAGSQMLQEVGDVLTTPEGQSTAPQLQSTLRQLLQQHREVTTLALLRALPVPRLRLQLDALLSLAEQWRRQIEHQSDALTALQALALPQHDTRVLLMQERQHGPQRVELRVPHRRELLPVDLWPARGAEASHHPWLLVLPGLGGNADQLGWFAGALSRRGWSVAVPQHPGSDGRALQEALAGRLPPPGAATLAVRLKDVEAVLAARREGRITLPGTGMVLVGHSLGGLTALLAAGVKPEPGLAQRCNRAIERLPIGNPSRLLQCELVNTGVPAALTRPDDLRGLVIFNGFGSLLWPSGATTTLPVPVLMVGGSLDLVTPPLEEQLRLFLPAGHPRSRLVLVEGGSHFSPVRMVERQEAVLRLGREWVGVDPAMVQTLLLSLGTEFLHSLDIPQLLPAQVRTQQGVRAYVLDPTAARRWRGRIQS